MSQVHSRTATHVWCCVEARVVTSVANQILRISMEILNRLDRIDQRTGDRVEHWVRSLRTLLGGQWLKAVEIQVLNPHGQLVQSYIQYIRYTSQMPSNTNSVNTVLRTTNQESATATASANYQTTTAGATVLAASMPADTAVHVDEATLADLLPKQPLPPGYRHRFRMVVQPNAPRLASFIIRPQTRADRERLASCQSECRNTVVASASLQVDLEVWEL